MICIDCEQEFKPEDSLGGEFGQCQDCWEKFCSSTWWEIQKEIAIEADNEKFLVAHSMFRNGGSFVKKLGEALMFADPLNSAKIKTAFSEYWYEYLGMADRSELELR